MRPFPWLMLLLLGWKSPQTAGAPTSDHITFVAGSAVAWTDMPSAETELFGTSNRRVPVSLAGRTSTNPVAALFARRLLAPVSHS